MKISEIMKKFSMFLAVLTVMSCAEQNIRKINSRTVATPKKENGEEIYMYYDIPGRYIGGYVDGYWFPFYKRTLFEKECLRDRDDYGEKAGGCSDMGYIGFESSLKIIGIAELNDKIILKVSDYRMVDYEGNVYTPYDYPSETKDKAGKYFPVFIVHKDSMMENLKSKSLKFNFNGKTWDEVYYTDKEGEDYIVPSVFKKYYTNKRNYYNKVYSRKKIKFSGVEEIEVDAQVAASYYYTITSYLCLDFTRNVETC